MGVSENSVPLNPMVNDHYPYEMAIIGNIPGNIPYFQTNPNGWFGGTPMTLETETFGWIRANCSILGYVCWLIWFFLLSHGDFLKSWRTPRSPSCMTRRRLREKLQQEMYLLGEVLSTCRVNCCCTCDFVAIWPLLIWRFEWENHLYMVDFPLPYLPCLIAGWYIKL